MSSTAQPDVTNVTDEDVGASAGNKGDNPLMSGRPVTGLPEPIAAKLEQQRMLGQITAALASQTWGQRMTPVLRRATAQYCLAYGIDPLTELDMLGGTPYVNAEFYLRKLGELRVAGIVADYWLDNISPDEQLLRAAAGEHGGKGMPDDIREWATAEHWRRWQRRRELGAKETAEAVVACHVVLAGGGHPIVGWKQGGGGTSIMQRSKDRAAPNPVVEDENNTALAVESQAARRAVRQFASHVNTPSLARVAEYFSAVDHGASDLRERIEAAKPSRPAIAEFNQRQVSSGGYEEVLGSAADRGATGEREPVTHVVTRPTAPAARAAVKDAGRDPYTEQPGASSAYTGGPEKSSQSRTGAADSTREARRWAPTNVDVFPGSPPRKSLPRKAGDAEPGGEVIRVCSECGQIVTDFSDHNPDCSHYADPD